jgi:hypothetical protein
LSEVVDDLFSGIESGKNKKLKKGPDFDEVQACLF